MRHAYLALALALVLAAACSSPAHDSGDSDAGGGGGGGGGDGGGGGGGDAPLAGDAGGDAPACVPRACTDTTALSCGSADDGCGHTLACGTCPGGLTCGAVQPNACGIAPAARTCSATGWCWEQPLPVGMDLFAVWGATGSDMWAAGDGGTLLHYGANGWQPIASGTDDTIAAIFGTAANDVWIGGKLYLRIWNGATLTTNTVSGAPTDLWVTDISGGGANDMWVVGEFGTNAAYHWNGSTWTDQNISDELGFVHWFSDTDVITTNFQWNGAKWTATGSFPAYSIFGPATDAWGIGTFGIYHGDGSAWTNEVNSFDTYSTLSGASGSDIWAGGETVMSHYDGSAWTPLADPPAVERLVMTGPGAGWGVGYGGAMYQLAGGAWTQTSGFGNLRQFVEARAFGDDDATLVHATGLVQWHDGVLTDVLNPDRMDDILFFTSWIDTASDVYAADDDGPVYHYDGHAWALVTGIPLAPPLVALAGSGPNDVWEITRAQPLSPGATPAVALHFDGTAWTVVKSFDDDHFGGYLADATAIALAGPNDVWIATNSGAHHFDGTTWTDLPATPDGAEIEALFALPGFVVAGSANDLYQWSGTAWVAMTGGANVVTTKLVGSSATDVWAWDRSDDDASALHWTGSAWARENPGIGQPIASLALAPHQLLAVGQLGGILGKTR